jgi:PKD repeat protein
MIRKLFTVFIAVCVCAVIYPQFGMVATATSQTKFSVDVLLDYGNGTKKWSTCILSKPGNDTVYNATQATATTLNITWYGDAILVDAIDGVWNSHPYYWIWWYWNFTESKWIIGPVACNHYILNDCDIVAWYYENCTVWPPAPPPNPPVTLVDVLVDYGNGTVKWHENVDVMGVASVFKATKAVATLDYSLWGDDIFVDAINGVWNNYATNYFWLYWYWNSTSMSWNCGPVACNKYFLKNGDIIAWYYETSPWGPPSATPHPVANFTWTPSIPKVGESVIFDASASTPNGGTILKYEWNFGDGKYAVGKIVSHAYTNPNTYTVTLNVSDSNGLWDIEQKQILVVKPHSPKAEFTATPETARPSEIIKFNASASLLGWNGTHTMPITEYRWNFGDGNMTTTTTPIIYHSYKTAGNYYVTLTVYAPGATPETDSTTRRITIISVPVGGYSFPIEGYAIEKPLTPYLALVAILTAVFTTIRRKIYRRE